MNFISSNFRDEIVYIEDLIQVVISYISYKNIPVFSEKTDVPHLPNQCIVAISVMKLWPWKLDLGHQTLISYWSCPI